VVKICMSISGLHTKKHILGRKPGTLFLLGALWFTLACGVLEKVPAATREARQTAMPAQLAATQASAGASEAAENDAILATVSARSTAQAQVLILKLTEMSAELKITPAGSDGVPWTTRWLTAPACQPPCWANITPGITTMEEAVKIVYQIPGVELTWLPTMDGATEAENSLQWEFGPSGYGWVGAESGQEIVSEIHLGAGEKQLLLGAVIAAYGNPSTVVKGSCHGGVVGGSTCIYSIVYPDLGMELDIGIHEYQKIDVQADTEVSGIYFYPLTGERLGEPGVVWSGFGQYDFSER
jgi:hypothetical protein